jgi:glycosyltransferase involved in cell wall biosynthesis
MSLRICVVTPRFTISGVPLAQLRFARALAQAGHQVDLVVGYVPESYSMPAVEDVRVIVLDRPKVRSLVMPLWRYLRRERPDVVFAAEDHLTALVLFTALIARSRAKISGSSRVTPFDTYSAKRSPKNWVLKQVMRLFMRRADALTCVSKDMVEQYRQVFHNAPHVCVYNIVDDPASRERMREPVDDLWFVAKDRPVVVAAGMLAHWKGFEDLIDAFALLRDRGRDVRLVILGEGPDRAKLEAQIARLRLDDRVRLPGHTPNPLKFFAHADVFALSSRVEGMPNVLVEAMMCGCTVVAADCPTGPRELLDGGRYGYLVPPRDPVAMADGIEAALERPIAPEITAQAITPFHRKAVLDRHFAILGLS